MRGAAGVWQGACQYLWQPRLAQLLPVVDKGVAEGGMASPNGTGQLQVCTPGCHLHTMMAGGFSANSRPWSGQGAGCAVPRVLHHSLGCSGLLDLDV